MRLHADHTVNMWVSRMERAVLGFSNISPLSLYYLMLILSFHCRLTAARVTKEQGVKVANARGEKDAIQRLSKVFGIDHVPRHSVKATPPQFMLELFNDITDYGGLIRKDGPYNASTIVSFPDKAYNQEMHFQYNVSRHSNEHLLESEFHVFRMTPKSNSSRIVSPNARLSHIIEVQIFQVLDPQNMYSDKGRQLLDKRRISAHTRGWLIFNVTKAVRLWVSGLMENHGLLVISRSVAGQDLGVDDVRFAQRNAHHDSKQPILVVYTNDGRARTPHYISPQDREYKQIRKDIKRQERRYTKKHQYNYDNKGLQNAIKLLNEKSREEYGHPFFTRNIQNNSIDSRKRRSATLPNGNETPARRKKRKKRTRKNKKDKGKRGLEPRYSRQRRSCTRRHMYVDFDEIGWEGWIISPKGYNAYHCKGECPFPLGQSQRPTNHATVQSIVHALKVGKGVSTPCCVPNKLYSISLLYFDDDENVILKQYDDMVAASCGCH